MSSVPREAEEFLLSWMGEKWEAEPLRGDASVRGYYRIRRPGDEPVMLCFYPQELRPDVERFMRAYTSVEAHAPVPRVLRHDAASVAQYDVGDVTLYDILRDDRERGIRLYEKAIDVLVGFQGAAGTAAEVNPPFDVAKFSSELGMTIDFYVEKLSGITGSEQLLKIFYELSIDLTTHPYVLCHRDYHGQNIHILNDSLYVIDYQDMRMGPDTYDLASLLRDRGVGDVIGEKEEERLLAHYASRIGADEGIRRRYFANLLQRSLKTVGTFARQAIERGRTHYLEFIPGALRAASRALDELPEYAPLRDLFPMRYTPSEQR